MARASKAAVVMVIGLRDPDSPSSDGGQHHVSHVSLTERGIVRHGLDDCSCGLGSSIRREQYVEPGVQRLDEGPLTHVDVDRMSDSRAPGAAAAEFAAVIAAVVALVRSRHPSAADCAVGSGRAAGIACHVDVALVAHGCVWSAHGATHQCRRAVCASVRATRSTVCWVPTHAPHVAIRRARSGRGGRSHAVGGSRPRGLCRRAGSWICAHGTRRPAVGVTMRNCGLGPRPTARGCRSR